MVHIALVVLMACGGDSGEDSGTTTGTESTGAVGQTTISTTGSSDPLPTGAISHATHIQPIWDARCGGACHLGNASLGDLSVVDGYAAMVDVDSMDVPGMLLVAPGDLDESYLWHKLEGTHIEAGGAGLEMPKGQALSDSKRSLVEAWILGGALP